MKRLLLNVVVLVLAVALVAEAQSGTGYFARLIVQLDALAAVYGAGATLQNTTAATSGVTIQNSPGITFSGTAWDGAVSETVSAKVFVAPVPLGTSVPNFAINLVDGIGVEVTAMSFTPSNVSLAGSLTATAGSVNIAAGGNYGLNGRSRFQSGADGRITFNNSAGSSGLEIAFGAQPTLTSCGTGTITSGSRNSAGEVTATGATSCTVTFAGAAFNNSPFCVANNATSASVPIMAVTGTTSFTVSGLTSGDRFFYICLGRF